jgi:hypothetical protein
MKESLTQNLDKSNEKLNRLEKFIVETVDKLKN